MRLRRLGQELRRIREDVLRLSQEEVEKSLGWGKGRVSYIENAKGVKAQLGNVTLLLDLYGIGGVEREQLLALTRQTQERGWWGDYRDVFQSSYPAFEDAASTIRTYDQNVPGLLQTPEYAAAVIKRAQVLDPAVVARKVQARQKRQELLAKDHPPRYTAIMDEAALRRSVGGPEVMQAQIRHLIELAAWPNITIQVLRLRAGAHAAMEGGFVILDFPSDDPSLVYLEFATTSLFMESATDVQSYTFIFEAAVRAAETPDDTLDLLAALRDQQQR